ncbi:MAG: hypothetical protein P4M05_15070 [Bradyrhizobium sp.]|nr:hypothetical protein [Bradyrhizobium sp.]
MIRDVMVWLDGGTSDEVWLAAVADIARRLESNVVIGLFLNPLPLPGPVSGDATVEQVDGARKAGDEIERLLAMRLQLIEQPVELRRFDVLADDITNIAARERGDRAGRRRQLGGPGRHLPAQLRKKIWMLVRGPGLGDSMSQYETEKPIRHVFLFIGADPATSWLRAAGSLWIPRISF